MSFEEFNSKGGKFTPQVTINKGAGFGLSSGMHHRFGLDQYIGVKLYFDKDEKKIGIKLLESPLPGMFKLKKRPNEKGAYFGAKSFMQAYQLDTQDYAGRYNPEQVEDPHFGKLFIIHLNNE